VVRSKPWGNLLGATRAFILPFSHIFGP